MIIRILEVCHVPDTFMSICIILFSSQPSEANHFITPFTDKETKWQITSLKSHCLYREELLPASWALPTAHHPGQLCNIHTYYPPPCWGGTSPTYTFPRAQIHKTTSPNTVTKGEENILFYHGANTSTSFFCCLSECWLGVSNFHKISLMKRKDKTKREFDGKLSSKI